MSLMQNATLEEAKQWLKARLEKGAHCPCCAQFAKVYRRRINSGMARSLIMMYLRGKREWIYIPTAISAKSREEGKLVYWGLIEESSQLREDGGRAGWWRVTEKGETFIHRRIKVPKYAFVYDAKLLHLDDGEMVDIEDCLGVYFDLSELMGWQNEEA